jgi:PAS domain S-box-containing protein
VGVYLFGYDVSERVFAEQAMQQSEERLRAVTDTIPDAIIEFDTELKVRYANRIAAEAIHATPGEMIGRSLHDLVPQAAALTLEARYRRALAGEGFTYEGPSAFQPDRVLSTVYVPRFGPASEVIGFYAFAYDVTDRARAERAMREAEERIRTIADAMPSAIVYVDREQRFRFVNRTFYEWSGKRDDEVVGHRLPEVYGAEFFARIEPLIEMVLGGKEFSVEASSLFRPDRIIQSTYLPHFGENREVLGYYYFGYDITPQKTAEAEVRRLNADLERRVAERTAELEASNRELEAFAYSVAHDLRTPLRAIDGFSQAVLLQSATPVDEAMRSSLDRVRAASQRMGRMIDDLLRLARVTRGELKRQEIDLSVLAQEILFDLRQAEPRREVEVVIQPGVRGNGDPILMHAVFENLFSNAWKFTRRKAHARIEFGRRKTASGEAYFVSDNGAGFDMAYANKLFSPFQRLHGAEEYAGNGIGLATVHRILQRHGGRIWAEAAPNRGATFYFTL